MAVASRPWQSVAAALTVAGGCSNQSATKSAIPAETKPAPSKPAVDEKKMSVTKEAYGKLPDGTQIDQYTLSQPATG